MDPKEVPPKKVITVHLASTYSRKRFEDRVKESEAIQRMIKKDISEIEKFVEEFSKAGELSRFRPLSDKDKEEFGAFMKKVFTQS